MDLITGVFKPTGGQVAYEGKDITGMKPHEVAALGIGRTFQLNPLFADFTVLENVSASFHLRPKSSLLDIYFNTPTYRKNEAYIRDASFEILKVVGLERVKDELARNLPHGYQKMLGVARALATRPKLLLLDEPLGGMNPSEIDFTLKSIRKTRAQGATFLIVEHNMQSSTSATASSSSASARRSARARRKKSGKTNRSSGPTSVANMLLEMKNITVHYGKSLAIEDVSLSVPEGSVVSVIGANGSGKSTVLKALVGLVPLSSARYSSRRRR